MEEREGTIVKTKQGYELQVIKYYDSLNSTVKFLTDRGNTLDNVTYDRVLRGTVVNPYHPNKYRGYMGEGEYKSSYNRNHSYFYKVWSDMIKRVYGEEYHKIKPTYKNIKLCEGWHNYQNFAKWSEDNYVEGWKLDKDIICPDCKIYSPETCAYVPNEVNGIFSSSKSTRGDLPMGVIRHKKHYETYFRGKFLAYGFDIEVLFNVYKQARETYIKELAEKYRHKLDGRVYKAMYEHEVKITD